MICGWLAFLPSFEPVLAWLLFGFLGACPIQYMTVMVAAFPDPLRGARHDLESNLVVFSVIFAGQWAMAGSSILWPHGNRLFPDGYTWAFGALFILQLAGLLWLVLSRAHPMARPQLAVAG